MTRAQARAYFQEKGLTYSDISCTDLELLTALLNMRFAEARRARIAAGKPVHWQRVIGVRGEYMASGSMIWTKIVAKGASFSTSNVIIFNLNGYINFCSEASEEHLQPVMAAFAEWCDKLAEMKEIGEGGENDVGS